MNLKLEDSISALRHTRQAMESMLDENSEVIERVISLKVIGINGWLLTFPTGEIYCLFTRRAIGLESTIRRINNPKDGLILSYIHTRLAKIMGLLDFPINWLKAINERTRCNFMKFILSKLINLFFYFDDFIFKCANLAFKRIAFIHQRVLFYQQINAGRLNFNNLFVQHLVSIGKLRLVSGINGSFKDLECSCNGGNNIHGNHPNRNDISLASNEGQGERA